MLLLLLSGLGAPVHLQAQPDPASLLQDQWTTAEGLPVNGLTDILQTRDGYLWIASWDGLARFDGMRFTVFNRSNTPGLPSNRLFKLYETPDRILWIHTEHNQLAAFRNGDIAVFGPDDGLLGNEVSGAFWGNDSTLHVATNAGLFAWRDGQFVRQWSYSPSLISLPDGFSLSTGLQDQEGTFWMGTFQEGLLRLAQGQLRAYTHAGNAPLASILALAEDERGRIWVQAAPWQQNRQEHFARGLFLVDGDSLRRVEAGAPEQFMAWGREVRVLWRDQSRCILLLDGQFFVGSRVPSERANAEAWEWNVVEDARLLPGGKRSFVWWDFVYREDGFLLKLPFSAYGALWDHEGSLWLATNGEGLHRYRSVPFTTFGVEEGLTVENVYPILADRQGRLWTAPQGERGVFRHIPCQPVRHLLREEAVLALYEDRRGTIWIGTNTGVCFIASGTDVRECIRLDFPGQTGEPVYSIYQDREGGYWFGGDRKLWRYAGDSWQEYPDAFGDNEMAPRQTSGIHQEKPRAPNPPVIRTVVQARPVRERIRSIAEDGSGTLWFGAAVGGVTAFVPDPLQGYRSGHFYSITSTSGLPSNTIRDLYVDGSFVWVVTEDAGLARLDLRNATTPDTAPIAIIQKRHGLPEDALHSLRADAFGRYWISSNKGLFRLDKKEIHAFADEQVSGFRAVLFTERDGLRNREFNGGFYPASSQGPDGRLWFPSQAGAVMVDPAQVLVASPPRVVVEQLVSGDSSVTVSGPLRLSARQRTFEVAYTALTFLAPEDVRFRYRLEGFDRNWVEAGNRRTAYYTQVPAGTYTFRVLAAGKEGIWNETGATFRLTVRPFFYETVWFFALMAFLVVGLVGAGYQWRVRHLRARQQYLETVVEERTREVVLALETVASQAAQLRALDAAKSRFFANISHEFRTPLTLILGPLQQVLALREVPVWMRESLRLMQRNAHRLHHLINQLLDLARLDAGGMALQLRRQDLVAFVQQGVALFESVARLRGITLHVEAQARTLPFTFDEEKLEKVVLNLLSNALKFTSEGGTVTVTVTASANGGARLSVADTGIGIPAEHLPYVFNRFYQVEGTATRKREGSGIGLSLAHDLVALHGGTLTVESTAGEGSTFIVTLPDQPEPEQGVAVADAESAFSFRLHYAEPAEEDASAIPAPMPGGAETAPLVLVVEDNADLRQYLRSHLDGAFRVIEASDGAAGLERALSDVPDLVLSDVMMPEMDGYALCRALKVDRRTSHIPVVLLTARDDVPSKLEGLESGADDYLPKPFHPEEVRARLRNLITQRHLLRARFSQRVLVLGTDERALPVREVSFLEQVKSEIEAHVADADYGVDLLAEGLGLSRSQLERKLHALVGETPGHLIRRMRLERAAQLLRQEQATVKEVAAAVGFRSVSHFSEVFRQVYGKPPSAFAESVGG